MKFVSYSLTQIAVTVATAALVVGYSLWLVPMKNHSIGDLARIGWRANNYWGPKIPLVEFSNPLIEVGGYDKYYDVHILGDSFSIQPSRSWPNYVAAAGLSVRVQFLGKDMGTAITELMESPVFRTSPPKVLVYAPVERGLYWRFRVANGECSSDRLPSPNVVLMPGRPLDPQPRELLQPNSDILSGEQLTYSRDFLVAQILKLFKRSHEVYELPLTASRFSNVKADRVLVHVEDIDKAKWTASEIEHMRCALRVFRDRVQSNGRTLFVAMIVPDKLSIYHDDLVDTSLPSTVIPRLVDTDLLAPRLDVELRAAVAAGQLDVYLPSDTHWGTAGVRIAGESFLMLLRNNRFLVN